MLWLETLMELDFLNWSFSSSILLSKLDQLIPIKQFEAAASKSRVPSLLSAVGAEDLFREAAKDNLMTQATLKAYLLDERVASLVGRERATT